MKVDDFVRRKPGIIPDEEFGAKGLSVGRVYKIIWISPKGLLVLDSYRCLVSPEFVEVIAVEN